VHLIRAFDKGAAIHDRSVAEDLDEFDGDRRSNRSQCEHGEP